MLKIIRVSGDSLTPEYREGDFVLVVKIPFFSFHISAGDIVVFEHPIHGLLIKRVQSIDEKQGQVFVKGDQANSLDSRQFGTVKVSSIKGKVVWHIRQPQR
jgi:nickel-type superoxide dismutase maturation protease